MVSRALACDAANHQLSTDFDLDTVTRNKLLQVPKQNEGFGDCDIGAGCDDKCNQKGSCARARHGVLDSPLICQCDKGFEGRTCSVPIKNCSTTLVITMSDGGASSGWFFARFLLSDVKTLQIPGSFQDTMPARTPDGITREYCVPPGEYHFRVSKGLRPVLVSWTFCGRSGSAPFLGLVHINASGRCAFKCEKLFFSFTLLSAGEDGGWNDAYYALYAESSGEQLLGGTLSSSLMERTEKVCVETSGCYLFFIEDKGDRPQNVLFEICGQLRGSYQDMVHICIDEAGKCSVTLVAPPQTSEKCTSDGSGGKSLVPIHFFSPTMKGWKEGASITLVQRQKRDLSSVQSLEIRPSHEAVFHSLSTACVPDGCYDLNVTDGYTKLDIDNYDPKDNFWMACHMMMAVPWTSQLCIDSARNLCYGITGCPTLTSQLDRLDRQWFIVFDDKTRLVTLGMVLLTLIMLKDNVFRIMCLCRQCLRCS